jgi:hypothetical protein
VRKRSAALKAWSGAFALLWAALSAAGPLAPGTAAPGQPASTTPGVESAKVPSIQILQSQNGLAGTCGGGAFNVNTFINVGTQASADVRLSVAALGVVEEFTDETGKNIGPYAARYPSFHIPAFGGGLAPNTELALTITTYSGPALTGIVEFTSALSFNCTTGAVIRASADVSQPVPALSEFALFASAALLALLGAAALRRRANARGER